MAKEWSKKDIEFITNNYNILTAKEIATCLDRGVGSIRAKALRLNLTDTCSRYSINEKYFDVIDTENKAYWLGFLWCDGYVSKRYRNITPTYEMNFRLAESDVVDLEKFKEEIESTHEIKILDSGEKSFGGNHCKLYISNNHMCQTLYEDYGIIPHRKDASKLLNKMPRQLEKYFMRGLVDGDGSFSMYDSTRQTDGKTYKKYHITFGGCKDVLDFCNEHLIRNGVIKDSDRKFYKRHEDRDGDYLSFIISGGVQTISVLNYLYDNANVYLERKYKKYIEITK